MKAVSRERTSRRATEALRTSPPSVASAVGVSLGLAVGVSLGLSVPVILSQQVGGGESEHWSGAT